MAYTKEQRMARWKQLAIYIRRTGSLPAAQALAKREGVSEPTAAWLTAMSKILTGKV